MLTGAGEGPTSTPTHLGRAGKGLDLRKERTHSLGLSINI